MATLKDLAQKLGLSTATVSRALNGFPEVGAETRARVEQAALEMNYRPNPLARRLATGKSGVVGMIFRSANNLLIDPHFTEFLGGLCTRLGEAELDLMFHVAPPGQQFSHYERYLGNGSVDGMIVSAPEMSDQRIELLLARGFPFVVHGHNEANPNYAFYDIDNIGAAYAATTHLCELGHTHIALVNGGEHLAYAVHRREGFSRALNERGLTLPDPLVSHSMMREDMGYEHAKRMLSQSETPPPTAFYCSSTLLALGVYRALGEVGLKPGQDVAVVAHDDVLPHMRSEHFTPALSVTRAPIRDASGHLADMMAKLLKGTKPKDLQVVAPVELVIRQSSGSARV